MESLLLRGLESTFRYWLKSFNREQFRLLGRSFQLYDLGMHMLLFCIKRCLRLPIDPPWLMPWSISDICDLYVCVFHVPFTSVWFREHTMQDRTVWSWLVKLLYAQIFVSVSALVFLSLLDSALAYETIFDSCWGFLTLVRRCSMRDSGSCFGRLQSKMKFDLMNFVRCRWRCSSCELRITTNSPNYWGSDSQSGAKGLFPLPRSRFSIQLTLLVY